MSEIAIRKALDAHHTRRMLHVSAMHMPLSTASALEADPRAASEASRLGDLLSYDKWSDQGLIMWVTDDPGLLEDARDRGHGALVDLLEFARKHGFEYVKLDPEADPLPPLCGLPVFDWDAERQTLARQAAIQETIRTPDGARYKAIFRPQAWQRDWAVAVDAEGETEWYVTDWMLPLTEEEREQVLEKKYGPWDYNVALQRHPSAPQWVKGWTGPFEIDVEEDIKEAIDG